MKKAGTNKDFTEISVTETGKIIRAVMITFFLFFFCFSALFYGNIKSHIEINRERIQYITNSQTSKLNAAMAKYLNNMPIWEVLVKEHNGVVENFDKIAATLYEHDSAVRSIQLAPNGVVTQIYPLKGNEKGFVDLFADPARRTEAEYARDSGKMTLAGPLELYQGGLGIIARNPIYLDGDNGEQEFWGFAIVVLNVPEIFEMAELSELYSAGYEYKLWRLHPDTGEVQIILESSEKVLQNPTKMSFEVPNSTWNFDVAPIDGWVDYRECLYYFLAAILLSVLLSSVTWLIMHLRLQKKQLAVLSYTDGLTNLFNLRKLLEHIKKYDKNRNPFGIIFLDLNGFKKVNDTYGHDAGDQLLVTAAERLSKIELKEQKTVFRVGGDEFIMQLDGDYETSYYCDLIEQLKQILLQDIIIEGTTLNIKTSAGFARFPYDDANAENIIKLADESMYAEKDMLYKQ